METSSKTKDSRNMQLEVLLYVEYLFDVLVTAEESNQRPVA